MQQCIKVLNSAAMMHDLLDFSHHAGDLSAPMVDYLSGGDWLDTDEMLSRMERVQSALDRIRAAVEHICQTQVKPKEEKA